MASHSLQILVWRLEIWSLVGWLYNTMYNTNLYNSVVIFYYFALLLSRLSKRIVV